jgi:hypothetical protein
MTCLTVVAIVGADDEVELCRSSIGSAPGTGWWQPKPAVRCARKARHEKSNEINKWHDA